MRRMIARSTSSWRARAARRDGSRASRWCRKYVDGATGNSRQIGSTPDVARCWSMTAMLISISGRAPPARKTRTPSRESLRALQLEVFPLEPLQLCAFGGQARTLSRIPFRLAHPAAQPRLNSPTSRRTDRMATDCDGYSGECSWTSRTARSHSSGAYLLSRTVAVIRSRNQPSDKASTVHPRLDESASLRASFDDSVCNRNVRLP
jgi:hypothetical protein